MDKQKVDNIIRIKEEALRTVKKAELELEQYHRQNTQLCEEIYPEILKAIQTEVFDKGLCYKASYEWLEYGDKSMGPHYQLRRLDGEIIKYNKRKKYTYEDGVICMMEQCDNDVFQIRITNRYFSHYYPNYELLKKELNLDVKTN